MKLEPVSNDSKQIKGGRCKLDELKNTLGNIEMLYEAWKKLLNYLIIVLELDLKLNMKQFMEEE